MKFEEILPALREGKKVSLEGNQGFYFLDGEVKSLVYKNYGCKVMSSIDYEKLVSNKWEIVEEVKEPKKIKLRNLTEEQFNKWAYENCGNYDDKCNGCPFQKVYCDRNPDIDDWWIKNKDLYSDKFLDQEIEIYE